VQVLRLRWLPFLGAHPNLFEQMVKADFVVGGNGGAAVGRVSERAIQRVTRPVLRRVKVQMAVSQLDASVSLARDIWIVRYHQDGVAGVV